MVATGACLVAGGFLGLAKGISSSGKSTAQATTNETVPTTTEASPTLSTTAILVSVQGAVQQPGLLTVPAQARVGQVIEMAGGYSPQADQATLAENLNLAAKVEDGQQIWVPMQMSPESNGHPTQETSTATTANLISLNTASQSELESLPGIGPVRAQAIIAGRPYLTVDELLSRQIVSSAAFEALASLVEAP